MHPDMHFIMTDSESGTSIRFLKIVNIEVPHLKNIQKHLVQLNHESLTIQFYFNIYNS